MLDAMDNFNLIAIKRKIEGGDNMKDIIECSKNEIGRIIWLYKDGYDPEYIAQKLQINLFQIKELIKNVSQLIL